MTLSAPVTPDATHVARASNVVSVVQTAQGSEARVVQGPTIAWPDADSAFALLDRSAHAEIARLTGGLSPAALVLAFVDWRDLTGQAAFAWQRDHGGCVPAI
jgi:polyhydroxyalkanoate synthase subunit PhaC